jgi:hypothetical protein
VLVWYRSEEIYHSARGGNVIAFDSVLGYIGNGFEHDPANWQASASVATIQLQGFVANHISEQQINNMSLK